MTDQDNNNERPAFTMRRAEPVAGPGINRETGARAPSGPRRQRRVIERDGDDSRKGEPQGRDSSHTEPAATQVSSAERNPAQQANPGHSIPLDDVLLLFQMPDAEAIAGAVAMATRMTPQGRRVLISLLYKLWPEVFGQG